MINLKVMTTPLKTLFLNPPSFEKFDGGASSRWPATREIESYWYPVWLTYPAGMLEGSRLVDAPPHHLKWPDVVEILKDYEFLVLFTSTMGWDGDQKMAGCGGDTEGLRVSGPVYQHHGLGRRPEDGRGHQADLPQDQDCVRRPAGDHFNRPGAEIG